MCPFNKRLLYGYFCSVTGREAHLKQCVKNMWSYLKSTLQWCLCRTHPSLSVAFDWFSFSKILSPVKLNHNALFDIKVSYATACSSWCKVNKNRKHMQQNVQKALTNAKCVFLFSWLFMQHYGSAKTKSSFVASFTFLLRLHRGSADKTCSSPWTRHSLFQLVSISCCDFFVVFN